MEEVPYCFSKSSFKCQGHAVQKIDNLNKNTRPVAAFKSLRFALFTNISTQFWLHKSEKMFAEITDTVQDKPAQSAVRIIILRN